MLFYITVNCSPSFFILERAVVTGHILLIMYVVGEVLWTAYLTLMNHVDLKMTNI